MQTPNEFRLFVIFLGTMALAAFVLNWFWEMIQMTAFAGMAGRSWKETAARCTVATLGDVGIIAGIYAIGATAAGDPKWGLKGRWNVYATCAVLGFAYALLLERQATASGRWSYNPAMPLIPWLKVGLWPAVQLALLAPLSVWIGRRIFLMTGARNKTGRTES